jgi:hypothetical protein
MRVRYALRALALASVVLVGAIGSAAADDWKLLGEKILRANDPSTTITAESDKWLKEDVKKIKLSVEGADVQISKVVLNWNNAKDVTVTDVGVVKSGAFTAEKDAPTREGTLNSLAIQYKILNGALQATLKVWGYD